MSAREHGLRFVRTCQHRRTYVHYETGPLGTRQRVEECSECGRTVDIREVPTDG